MTAIQSQPMQALTRANDVRRNTAELKNQIRALSPRAGAELAADIIENDEDELCGAIRILALLLCVRRLGEHKVMKCLITAGIVNADRRLRDLTPRQRKAVAAQVRLWSAGFRS